MQNFWLKFSDGQQIDSSVLNLWQTLKFYSGGLYLLIRFIPSKMKRIPLLTGKKSLLLFGSTEGESSDDSLVDLVSVKASPLQNSQNMLLSQNGVSERWTLADRVLVTFYKKDLLPPRQLPLQEANLWTFKNKKNWSPGKMMSILKWLSACTSHLLKWSDKGQVFLYKSQHTHMTRIASDVPLHTVSVPPSLLEAHLSRHLYWCKVKLTSRHFIHVRWETDLGE